MSLLAGLMYRALVWKERQRARQTRLSPAKALPKVEHLATGRRGETLAYWYLRQAGYNIVARNQRSRSGAGELDLVGWDGSVLSFIEVKTRTSAEAGPPEVAVSPGKQKRVGKAAREYLRHLKQKHVNYRFDTVSVSWDSEAGLRVRLIKNAFKA